MVQRPRGGLSIQWLAIFIAARGRALYFFPAMTAKRFARESDLGLRERDYALLRRLDTPHKIQAYLHHLKQNFELDGDSCRPVREVLRTQRAHCIEGAMLAAAALWVHGEPPLLLDMRAVHDFDHVVALYRRRRHWGAIRRKFNPRHFNYDRSWCRRLATLEAQHGDEGRNNRVG